LCLFQKGLDRLEAKALKAIGWLLCHLHTQLRYGSLPLASHRINRIAQARVSNIVAWKVLYLPMGRRRGGEQV